MPELKSEKYVVLLACPYTCSRCRYQTAPFGIYVNDETGANTSEMFSCPRCLTEEEQDLLCIPERGVSDARFTEIWRAKQLAWQQKNHGRLVLEDNRLVISFPDRMFSLDVDLFTGAGTVSLSREGRSCDIVHEDVNSGRALLAELAEFYGYELVQKDLIHNFVARSSGEADDPGGPADVSAQLIYNHGDH